MNQVPLHYDHATACWVVATLPPGQITEIIDNCLDDGEWFAAHDRQALAEDCFFEAMMWSLLEV